MAKEETTLAVPDPTQAPGEGPLVRRAGNRPFTGEQYRLIDDTETRAARIKAHKFLADTVEKEKDDLAESMLDRYERTEIAMEGIVDRPKSEDVRDRVTAMRERLSAASQTVTERTYTVVAKEMGAIAQDDNDPAIPEPPASAAGTTYRRATLRDVIVGTPIPERHT